jgi:hypothetical protein
MKCLRHLEHWDRGFESHSKKGYLFMLILSVLGNVLRRANPRPRSPTDCVRLRNWLETKCFTDALGSKWEQQKKKKKKKKNETENKNSELLGSCSLFNKLRLTNHNWKSVKFISINQQFTKLWTTKLFSNKKRINLSSYFLNFREYY